VKLVSDLEQKGVGLVSLNDPVDTTTAQGRLVFRIFASLAEFEREVIKERTMAGLASARRRGQRIGRPEGLTNEAKKKARIAESLYREDAYSIQDIARQLSISKMTLYKYLRSRGIQIGVGIIVQ
jgi:DNA invertase Pin-like site-specific DNA recombinase